MADKYCDHGLYPAYAAVPTWATAQDGDGAAATLAVSSVASVVFSQGHSAGTVAVFGASVTFTHGATADIEANNLATAINASATVVSTTFAPKAPQLRNLVYARGPSSGAPAGTCQIMSRAGSAALNDTGNTSLTQASFNGTAPTLTQFSGGSSGAWGYFINPATVWPSATAALAYGALTGTVNAGQVGAGDLVHVRAGNKSISLPAGTMVAAMPAEAIPTFRVENGTYVPAWSADAADSTLTITGTSTSSANCTLYIRDLELTGMQYGAEDYNLKLRSNSTSTGGLVLEFSTRPGELSNFDFRYLGSTITQWCFFGSIVAPNQPARVHDFYARASAWSTFPSGASNHAKLEAWNGVFDGTGTISPAVIFGPSTRLVTLDLRAIEFRNFIAGSALFAGLADYRVLLRDMTMGNVTELGVDARNVVADHGWPNYVVGSSRSGPRNFYVTRPGGNCDWTGGKGYPTLNAKLPDGTTPWSWRIVPPTSAGVLTPLGPWASPEVVQINGLADGARTISMEFCLIDSATWTARDVSIRVEYEAVDGSQVILDSFDPSSGALTASTATWSPQVGGKPAWYIPTELLFNKYKLQVTTLAGKPMKSGSRVQGKFRVHQKLTLTTDCLFVDPEFQIV